ncbi:MAG: hypothetical protein AAFV53_00485 [Myxococcota bacterium]
MARAGLLSLLALGGCTPETVEEYERFNNVDDPTLSIEVGAAALMDPSTIELTSSTGQVVVGQATVDPSGGPVGTEHTLSVEVFDDYEDAVQRVQVRTASPDRGNDTYSLQGDSADEGFWQLTLVSQGAEDEVRTDTFEVVLQQLVGTIIVTGEDTGQ